MKKYLFFTIILFFGLGCDQLGNVNPTQGLTNDEIIQGLKEALNVGNGNAVTIANKIDGYFGNPLIKIPFPTEAEKIQTTLRSLGFGKLVDDAVLSLNRAAEDAAIKAKPIFINAITKLTISDGLSILNGDTVAATNYLHSKTFTDLKVAFKPDIQTSLDKVNATKYWGDVVSQYNKIPFVTPVNTDLSEYVTGKALEGLFFLVSKEEGKIRRDPVARVTDILRKVFGKN